MFDDVAPRYDLVNDVLSLGQDRIWRKVVARAVDATKGEFVLDVAAGTGTSSASFTTDGAQTVGVRFLPRDAAARRPAKEEALPSGECALWLATPSRCRSPTSPSTRSRSRSACATSTTSTPLCATCDG